MISKEKSNLIQKLIECPKCKGNISYDVNSCKCLSCDEKIDVVAGKLVFLNLPSNNTIENKKKINFLKKLRKFLTITSTYKTKTSRSRIPLLVDSLGPDEHAINIGSGNKNYGSKVLNIDIESQDAVDVLADSSSLPVKSESVTLAISQAVLEHTPNTRVNVSEITRVLKVGGILYVEVPFMQTFHAHPHDYFRFTHFGLKSLLTDYTVIQEGIAVGPASSYALNSRVFLSTLFCFGKPFLFKVLLTVFSWITFPIKYLDIFLENNSISYHSASGIFIIAKKKN